MCSIPIQVQLLMKFLFCSLTLKSRDSTHDSFKCACPIAFEHETKENIINENTCIKDFNLRENPSHPFKVYSKTEGEGYI